MSINLQTIVTVHANTEWCATHVQVISEQTEHNYSMSSEIL